MLVSFSVVLLMGSLFNVFVIGCFAVFCEFVDVIVLVCYARFL